MDYQIEPQAASEMPKLPRNNVQMLTEASKTLTLDEPWDLKPGLLQTLRVKTGYYTMNIRLNTRKPADHLVVTFHGARGVGNVDAKQRKGLFARDDWDNLYKAPILAISDPRCEDVWGTNLARVAMYTGVFGHDMVPEVNALVDKVCEELDIEPSRAIFLGASSGGSSAILVGARRPVSRVLAICAHLRSDKFRDSLVASAAQSAGGTVEDYERMNEEEPWRFSPIAAIKYAQEQGHDMKVVIAQNVRDFSTLNRHFPRFCTRFEIPTTGGVSYDGQQMALLYDHKEGGHGFEPAELSVPLWERTLEFFEMNDGA